MDCPIEIFVFYVLDLVPMCQSAESGCRAGRKYELGVFFFFVGIKTANKGETDALAGKNATMGKRSPCSNIISSVWEPPQTLQTGPNEHRDIVTTSHPASIYFLEVPSTNLGLF